MNKAIDLNSLARLIKKKGIGYFISSPSEEDKEAFEGILYDKGIPRLSLLIQLESAIV